MNHPQFYVLLPFHNLFIPTKNRKVVYRTSNQNDKVKPKIEIANKILKHF